MLECIFSDPLYFNPIVNELIPLNSEVLKTTTWVYSKMLCADDIGISTSTLPEYIEKIENADQNFFLQKTISYGDFLMIAFFIIFFVGFSVMGIRDFVKNRKLERL